MFGNVCKLRKAVPAEHLTASVLEWEVLAATAKLEPISRTLHDRASSATLCIHQNTSSDINSSQMHQFNNPHCDMASVVHYDYSCVLYITTGGDCDFGGGELVFCDDDAERKVFPRRGRLVGFSSGIENIHRINPVRLSKSSMALQNNHSSGRITLSMWFTTSYEKREYTDDAGWRREVSKL